MIEGIEIVLQRARSNFTMKASKEYLAIVGGDDGNCALPHIEIRHLMKINEPVFGSQVKACLKVPRVKPAVTFDKSDDSTMIVAGGWLDGPNCRDFAYSAECIDTTTGQTLRLIDFNKTFTRVPHY